MLAAGGSARRMGSGEPKQFARLGGVPLLRRALEPFAGIAGLEVAVAVVPAGEQERARAFLQGVALDVRIVAGGETRQASVRRGLAAVGQAETVLVHDAARPLASRELVERVLAAAREGHGAIPVVAIRDTLKRERDGRVHTVAREALRAAQTPQGFPRRLLEEVHRRAADEGFVATDDAGLFERYDLPVRLVEGEAANVKITEPADLVVADSLLALREGRSPAAEHGTPCTGIGYDVHRLEAGRPCILGGVRFEAAAGPVGHSDADVLTHAVMDALLGAAGQGDIGHRFPPGDPRFAGADSLRLLRDLAAELRARFEVVHVDAVVVAEAPRIAPRLGEVRSRLAEAIGVDVARVNVKATTAEGLGALGRGEGIAAQAVATLSERL